MQALGGGGDDAGVGLWLPPSAPLEGVPRSSAALLRFPRQLGLEAGPIRFAADDEVVGVAGEAVDGALGPDGVGECREPFVRSPI